MFNRIRAIFQAEGKWALYMLPALAINRINVAIQRFCLGSRDIYFQGPPKILGRQRIAFGENFRCGKGAWLEAIHENGGPDVILKIGNNVTASMNLHIAAVNMVVVGDNVLLGSNVLITDHDHGYYGGDSPDSPVVAPNARKVYSKGPVVIGTNVWLGDGVKVLSNVTIGDGAIIAANTVVTRNVDAGTIIGSVGPARTIKAWDSELNLWK